MKKIADKIIAKLKREGFIIQRYDSKTSKSIYLKLDYGVSHSIRISDHPGKKHLKYRFNIETKVKEPYRTTDQGFERRYYGTDHINTLIRDILQHRHQRTMDFGRKSYQFFMKQNKNFSKGKKGFWKSAEEV